MNAVDIVGRLVADPELRHTQRGTAVCSFTVAVNRPRVKDTTDFLDCVAWQHSADYLTKYGRKGDAVAVSGVITTRTYTDKNGQKRKAVEIMAEDLSLIGGRREERTTAAPDVAYDPQSDPLAAVAEAAGELLANADDLPF